MFVQLFIHGITNEQADKSDWRVQTNEQTNSVRFDDEKRLKRRGKKRARASETVFVSLVRNYQAGLRRRNVFKLILSSTVPFDARLGERIT